MQEFPEFMRRSTLKIVGSPPTAMLGLTPAMTRQAVLSGTHGVQYGYRPQTTGNPPYGSRNMFGTPQSVNGMQPQPGGIFVAGRRRPFNF